MIDIICCAKKNRELVAVKNGEAVSANTCRAAALSNSFRCWILNCREQKNKKKYKQTNTCMIEQREHNGHVQ